MNSSAEPTSTPLGGDVHLIDTRMYGYEGITGAYLILSGRPCLVETGPALSAPLISTALRDLGIGPQDLATIAVTHVHLDHAGGVGDLAAAFPRARVVVQENGARHLTDPSRLMASAGRVYGPVLDQLFGRLKPTGQDRIQTVADKSTINLGGGRTLEAHHSPGHARHHIALLDTGTGDLYTGDAAGMYEPSTQTHKPTTPPPEFDMTVALHTLSAFRALAPRRLLYTHYGPVDDVEHALTQSAREIRAWASQVSVARADGAELAEISTRVRAWAQRRYRRLSACPEVDRKFEEMSTTEANVTGIDRWLAQQKDSD
jgi:glyoxylase-like metal-dependent hydrolase (beta-lactamase superfamily II)